MGIYVLSKNEIYEAVYESLEMLEGDFDSKTLKEVFDEIARDYLHTTDRIKE